MNNKKTREDFDNDVKLALKERAGSKCSFPQCRATTGGPSLEGPMKTSSTGVAAHIMAAAKGKGARRRLLDPNIDRKILKDYDNGIWMCQTHAKMIDDDEVSYTVKMLKRWRELAELKATLEHELKKSVAVALREGMDIPLAQSENNYFKSDIDLNTISNEIGTVVDNSCICDVWGEDVGKTVRNFVAEISINEFRHGSATEIQISIESNKVFLRSNGNDFDFDRDVLESASPKGGAHSVESVRDFKDELILSKKRVGQWNEIVMSFITKPSQAISATECALDYKRFISVASSPAPDFELYESCDTIYIVVPEEIKFLPSLALRFFDFLAQENLKDHKFVIVTNSATDKLFNLLNGKLANCRLMKLSEMK